MIPVVLVRTDRGANHLARPVPVRGRFDAACWRTITPGRRGVVWRTRDEIRTAWHLEWVCADCAELAPLPPERFLAATGWARTGATAPLANV